MSEQSIPALGQPRFPARGDVSEGCSAQMLSSELAQSSCRVLGTASYRTAGLVVTCFDKALFGGIIHRSCCGITRFTEPGWFSVSPAAFCGCAAAVVALA